ncbi:modified RING finger protein-like protein [Seal parapoxvirus]|uniref:Modified RING finger protein-like protein n=1 Tax=Seal parapoxvirus TaxID=187984 RepID=A0A1Z4CGG1_9POXV|nr:modified RING finger protein-like protein [Seal parapoxvirus]ASF89960.1 modified RING finger protein-like protein [Seal parapoxvirus]
MSSVRVRSWKLTVQCALAYPNVCYICNKAAADGCINGTCPGACPFMVLVCGHGYHAHCFNPANSSVCFVCRSGVQRAELPDESAGAAVQEFMI